MPIGMAVLYRLTPPERRGAIFGLFGLPIMVAPALGPVLSGYLLRVRRLAADLPDQRARWRFWRCSSAMRALPSIPAGRLAGALDSLGIVLGPLAFASLSFGVSQSTAAGWTAPSTLAGIVVGLVALVLFVWRELSIADPVLELRVFRGRDFSLGILTQWAAISRQCSGRSS